MEERERAMASKSCQSNAGERGWFYLSRTESPLSLFWVYGKNKKHMQLPP